MDSRNLKFLHRRALLHLFAALPFFAFFQIGKISPFRGANPFSEDPYDAVGSLAIQLALFAGILSYARSLRLLDAPGRAAIARLVLRGDFLVLVSISATFTTDALAEALDPRPQSFGGNALLAGLVFLSILTVICTLCLRRAATSPVSPAVPSDLTPSDAIDDLWSFVHVAAKWASSVVPSRLLRWILTFESDRLFSRLPWLHPRAHPRGSLSRPEYSLGHSSPSPNCEKGCPRVWQAVSL